MYLTEDRNINLLVSRDSGRTWNRPIEDFGGTRFGQPITVYKTSDQIGNIVAVDDYSDSIYPLFFYNYNHFSLLV